MAQKPTHAAGTHELPSRPLVFANSHRDAKIREAGNLGQCLRPKNRPGGVMDFEEELRERLRATGMTPSAIGAEAGVDYSQIYRFLNGQTQLRSGTVAKLCDWADLSLTKRGEPAGAT